jgi:hypothetical protein
VFIGVNNTLWGQNTLPYLRAFKYIKDHNRGEYIVVSDTITYLELSRFAQQIAKIENRENDNKLMLTLDSIDQTRKHHEFVLKDLKSLSVIGEGPVQIVYFSDLYKHMLIGEILEQVPGERNLGHRKQTSFNKAKQYLFVFDQKLAIKNVFEIMIQYD